MSDFFPRAASVAETLRVSSALRILLVIAGCAGVAHADTTVGVVAAVNQMTQGTPPSSAIREIEFGADIIFNERIKTNEVGLLQILLADGTTFTVGPNSEISIDSFVYDPEAGTAALTATLGKGVFRFIGGLASKQKGGVVISTSVATIGIRGAIEDIVIGACPEAVDEDCQAVTTTPLFAEETVVTSNTGEVTIITGATQQISISTTNDHATVSDVPANHAEAINNAIGGTPDQTGGVPAGSVTSALIQASGIPEVDVGIAPGAIDSTIPEVGSPTPSSAQ